MANLSFAADSDATEFEADWSDLRFGQLTYVDSGHVRLTYQDSFQQLVADFFGSFTDSPISGTVTNFEYAGMSLSGMSIELDRLLNLAESADVTTFLKGVLTGNDVVQGSTADEQLIGYDGDDRVYGFGGNDQLDGGRGVDRLLGGAGDDLYIIRDATDYVYENAGEGIDRVISPISYQLRANVENLSLSGSADIIGRGNDLDNSIAGNGGSNRLYGYEGSDRISGGAGDDRLDGGTDADRLAGGTGNDTYYVDSTSDIVVEKAGEGTDSVRTTANYTLSANVENGAVEGSSGVTLTGNAMNNVLYGGAGYNVLHGGDGDDRLYGDGDALYGETGNDVLKGNHSYLNGGSGDDVLTSLDDDEDQLIGGDGNDRYYADGYWEHTNSFGDFWHPDDVVEELNGGIDTIYAVNFDLPANVENGVVSGSSGTLGGNELANVLTGSDGADNLIGGAGNDTLNGRAGDDKIYGQSDNDVVIAGAGNDWIEGGASADTLTGGEGADTFNFFMASDSVTGSGDIITDFQAGVDTLKLTNIDANPLVDGDQAFTLVSSPTSGPGQLWIEAGSHGAVIVYADIDGDALADIQITLQNVGSTDITGSISY
ncbi:Ca2+-binding RTX toxin-like protein [Sphingomonas sp. F9_3S_D5_B_2]